MERVRTIAIQLESGRLPVPLKLVKESTVDAVLGADSLRRSLMAGLVGLALVFLFTIIYYRVPGIVAGMALLIYASIALAIFKLLPVTLTLAGIAGFILSIGMAVDANILIFERMKEELRGGRTLASAMEVGFNRAWPSIRDSNVSTFITCAILYWFGSRLGASLVMGFALTLFIGVAVSMFTAITVSRNLLQLVALTPVARRLNLFTPEPLRRPAEVGGRS
jgi:preprotein translocase subunit SecD